MTVRTIESTANNTVEEAQDWLTSALNDALTIPGNREAQVVISYLEEDGQLNVVTGQLDSSDGTWDCSTRSHMFHAGMNDLVLGDVAGDWGLKKFNQLADSINSFVEELVPVSDRDSEHDEVCNEVHPDDDDKDSF